MSAQDTLPQSEVAVWQELLSCLQEIFVTFVETAASSLDLTGELPVPLDAAMPYCGFLAAQGDRCKDAHRAAAMEALASGKLTSCPGPCGIELVAAPIKLFGTGIGALCVGLADPPTSDEVLAGVAERYGVRLLELRRATRELAPKSPRFHATAKENLQRTVQGAGHLLELAAGREKSVQDFLVEFRALMQGLVRALLELLQTSWRMRGALPELHFTLDEEGRIAEHNPLAQQTLGRIAEDLRGRRFVELVSPGEPFTEKAIIDLCRKGGRLETTVALRRNGESFRAELHGVSIVGPNGEGEGALLTVIDASARRELRDRVGEYARKIDRRVALLGVVNRVNAEIRASLDAGHVLQALCRELVEPFGLVRAAVLIEPGVTGFDRHLYQHVAPGFEPIEDAAAFDLCPRMEAALRKEGAVLPCLRAAVEREERLPEPCRACRLGVSTVMAIHLNVAGRRIGRLVLHEGKGRAPLSDEREAVTTVAEQAAVALKHALVHADVQRLLGEAREAKLVLERTQADLVQSEKLASLGQLSAGIAHEMQQPLFAIAMSLERLQPGPDGTAVVDAEGLEIMTEATARVRGIVKSLLNVAQGGEGHMEPVDLGEIARKALGLVKHELARHAIELDADLDGASPLLADNNALLQLLLNLFTNAIHAMPKGGELHVHASVDRAARRIRFECRDTGVGVPAALLPRVFDPYVTGRAGGTGLGLALVRSTVARHGGRISCESVEGHGATFFLELPLREQ